MKQLIKIEKTETEIRQIMQESISNKIQEAMESGIQLNEISKACGIDSNYLSKVKQGKKMLGLEKSYALSYALGISIDELVGGSKLDIGNV